MTIRDASSQEPGASPLAEFTRDGVTRLRPPSRFSFDYSAEMVDDAGDYVLEARLEDAASGELLATSHGVIAVITKDNPVCDITVTLVAPDGATG
jgi:Type III secretion system lipoprotein chaperone (YscW)